MSEGLSAAYGVFPEDVPVTDMVHALNDGGFHKEHICLMLARTHPISTVVRQAGMRNADREASAVAAELIEWLSEFGAVVIRNFGFFIRSQMFLRALVTAREAPALCGSSETLIGLGFSEERPNDWRTSCARLEFWFMWPVPRVQKRFGLENYFSGSGRWKRLS
jgi:hypothetical protein